MHATDLAAPLLSAPVSVDELSNAPCPMCGGLVQRAHRDEAGLITVVPCGCRI
jgi:hypothetical protein